MPVNPSVREKALDIFRAATMLLMIFVNDLWTLKNIPKWMEHASADQDFMGLADVVFPCFLVIVGMSIPYSVEKRIKEGDNRIEIIKHILSRTISLLIMGVFIVNLDNYNEQATQMGRQWFQLLMVFGFFLVWNQYPRRNSKIHPFFVVLQLLGIVLLAFLAIQYRGNDESGAITTILPQWWGILGLIGWAYGGCGIIYLFLYRKRIWLIAAWLFFVIVNILAHAGWLVTVTPSFFKNSLIIGDGAFHAFAMAGIMVTLIIKTITNPRWRILVIVSIGLAFVLTGYFLNNYFIISKIRATPPWIFLSTGIAYISYAIIFYLADVKGKANWFKMIRIAGTLTLTCYLIPYFIYPIASLTGLVLPETLKTGVAGILKSLLFSFFIIYLTSLVNRLNIRLKL